MHGGGERVDLRRVEGSEDVADARVADVHGKAVVDEDDGEDLHELGDVLPHHLIDGDEEEAELLVGVGQRAEEEVHLEQDARGHEDPDREVVVDRVLGGGELPEHSPVGVAPDHLVGDPRRLVAQQERNATKGGQGAAEELIRDEVLRKPRHEERGDVVAGAGVRGVPTVSGAHVLLQAGDHRHEGRHGQPRRLQGGHGRLLQPQRVRHERHQIDQVEAPMHHPDVVAEAVPLFHEEGLKHAVLELIEKHLLCRDLRIEASDELHDLTALA